MSRFSKFFPTTSLGVYLMTMAVLTVLPFLGFVVFLLVQLENSANETLRRDTAQDAQTIGRSVERRLQEMATTLRLLSTSPELKSGDLAAFQDRTASGLRASSLYMLLVNAEGMQLMNTRVPYGTSLGKISEPSALRSAIESGEIEVSGIFYGATGEAMGFSTSLCPCRGSFHLPPQLWCSPRMPVIFSSMTATDALPVGWSAAIIDNNGHVVVSSGPGNLPSGDPFPKEMLDLMTGVNESAVIGGSDPRMMLGYSKIPGWSWQAVVWGPISSAQESLLSTWRRLIFGSAALLVLGLLVAWAVAQQLRNSIREIASMAERMGEGEIVSPVVTKIVEANQVAIALSNASFDRRQAEERVHFILNELVHRTKNVLTLVQAMMRQLLRSSDSVEDFHAAISGRLSGLGSSIEALRQAANGAVFRSPNSSTCSFRLSRARGTASRCAARI